MDWFGKVRSNVLINYLPYLIYGNFEIRDMTLDATHWEQSCCFPSDVIDHQSQPLFDAHPQYS